MKCVGLHIICFWLVVNSLYCQKPITETKARTLNYRQFILEASECQDSIYRLTNATILYENERTDFKNLKIRVPIELIQCNFPQITPNLHNIEFERNISIKNAENLQLRFVGCKFNRGISVIESTIRNYYFRNCNIKGDFICMQVYGQDIRLYNVHFQIDKYAPPKQPGSFLSYHIRIQTTTYDALARVDIWDCSFQDGISKFVRYEGNFNQVLINSIDFKTNVLDFENCSIKQFFSVIKCTFNKPIGFEQSSFPPSETQFSFKQLKGHKICLYDRGVPFMGISDSELTDTVKDNIDNFNELISVYNEFYNIYRNRGDHTSANACYVEVKDIETHRLYYFYKKTPNPKNWFEWQLNEFLKVSCAYGTDPALAILYAWDIILWFAIIYFFFPSDTDNLKLKSILAFLNKTRNYFQTNKNTLDLWQKVRYLKLRQLSTLKNEYLIPKTLPNITKWLAYPVFCLLVIHYKLERYYLKRIDISPEEWTETKYKIGFWRRFLVTLGFIAFLSWGLFIRILNAFALSLNAFITMGFGEIRAVGISRYLAVLQGAIGWTLLTIFSASLISQILQ